jgi:hypothetical protein
LVSLASKVSRVRRVTLDSRVQQDLQEHKDLSAHLAIKDLRVNKVYRDHKVLQDSLEHKELVA